MKRIKRIVYIFIAVPIQGSVRGIYVENFFLFFTSCSENANEMTRDVNQFLREMSLR